MLKETEPLEDKDYSTGCYVQPQIKKTRLIHSGQHRTSNSHLENTNGRYISGLAEKPAMKCREKEHTRARESGIGIVEAQLQKKGKDLGER